MFTQNYAIYTPNDDGFHAKTDEIYAKTDEIDTKNDGFTDVFSVLAAYRAGQVWI